MTSRAFLVKRACIGVLTRVARCLRYAAYSLGKAEADDRSVKCVRALFVASRLADLGRCSYRTITFIKWLILQEARLNAAALKHAHRKADHR